MFTSLFKTHRHSLAKIAPIGVVVSSLLVVFGFQNCGQTPKSLSGSAPMTSTENPVVFDKNCLLSNVHDACIFFKNPTNTLTGVQSVYTLSELDQQQIYPVQLPKLLSPQFLKDSQIEVLGMDGIVVQISNVRQPASAGADGLSVLLATQSYYWARQVVDYFQTAQSDLLTGFQMSIVAEAPVLGWSPKVKTIFLLSDNSDIRKNSALDASTITHLTTEAIISFLSLGKIYDLTGDTHHKDCGLNTGPFYKADCCRVKTGCSKAISAGIADYINAMMFPSSPMLGDYISGDVDGTKSCSLLRNVNKHKTTTFQQAYDSCAISGRAGQFYDMGVALSATLLAVNSQLSADEKKAFLTILVKSIQQLKGTDNFTTFRDLLLAEAARSPSPEPFAFLIQSEFLKRM